MKKNLIYLIILMVLLGFAWWITQQDDRSTLNPDEARFSVEDTAAIDRIFLADKASRTILLEKQGPGNWTVNGKYPARADGIETLLSTLLRLEVKAPVPRAGVENVKKQISATGKKVEVYVGKNRIRTFYVGHPTVDSRGTYFINENAELPYIMYLPAWEGYVSPHFNTNEEDWRERIIMRLNPDSIVEIATHFPENPELDYVLRMPENRKFSLFEGSGKREIPVDEAEAIALFSTFKKIPVEGYDNLSPMRDSIVNMAPHFMEVRVKEANGKRHTVKTYFKSQLNTLDVVLLGVMPDLDRDYFFYEEANDFGFIQRRAVPAFYHTLNELKAKD
ncbi:MAG: DUF4340 domain-containing protein [Bacteroidia bacterium]